MIIALLPNIIKPEVKQLAVVLSRFLQERKIHVVADDSEAHELEAHPISTVAAKNIDFIISIGGDGTILRLVHRHPDIDAPIIGINMGSLGFLTDIPATQLFSSLEEILSGKFTVQERLVLQGKTEKGKSCFAINEVVIHRAKNPCLIDLAIFVDGTYLNTFSADGVIVATPSGSTAYSLSAGGPILTSDLQALVITPICPHAVSNRPIVLMPARDIKVQYIGKHDPVEIIFDGFYEDSLVTGQSLCITIASKIFKLVSLIDHEYFSTLRTKLGWSGSLKT